MTLKIDTTVISVTNPIWGNEEKTQIIANVVFLHLLDEFPNGVSFRADKNDVMQHGQDIFNDCVNNKYGTIGDLILPTSEELAKSIRAKRDNLLLELDSLVNNPLRYLTYSDSYKQELATYRTALLNVPEQPTFPNSVIFPTLPTEN
jgi:hypothetical protein